MDDRLNWIGTTADAGELGHFVNVQTLARAGTAYLSTPQGNVAEKSGVLRIDDQGPRSRLIVFDDGSSWTVTLPERKPCGCR